MNKVVITATCIFSLLPYALALFIATVLMSRPRAFPGALFSALIIACIILWIPTMAYFLLLVNRSELNQSAKASWLTATFLWAPFIGPVLWYQFCVRARRGQSQ